MAYETYDGRQIETAALTTPESEFLSLAQQVYDKGARWDEFQNFINSPDSPIWYVDGNKQLGRREGDDLVAAPIYQILRDMWLRLGADQGYVRMPAKVG